MLAAISECEGLKTGLFTSPYVTDFLERIMINGVPAEKEIFSKAALKVKSVIEENNLEINEFEFVTAVAFCIFKEQNCDIVMLETGLGGRFDATNIIKSPVVSVISSISRDHTEVLGDTVEKIAFEKAGIIKPGVPCVTDYYNEPGVKRVIKEACDLKNCKFYQSAEPKNIRGGIDGSIFEIENEEYKISLAGDHQCRNASLAVLAAKTAGFSKDSIRKGLMSAKNPARFEIISKDPLVILDGGHNEGCAEAIARTVKKILPDQKITAVLGMMADKDIDGFIGIIAPLCKSIITVTPSNPRSLTAEKLKEIAKKYCADVTAAKDISDALEKAGKSAELLICGSLYLAGDIREKAIKRFNNG